MVEEQQTSTAGERSGPCIPRQVVEGTDDSFTAHLTYWAAWLGLQILGRLPTRLRDAIVGGLARVAKRLDKRHSAAARRFLTAAYGDLPPAELERRVLQAYRYFLGLIIEGAHFNRVVLGGPDVAAHFEYDTSEEAEEVFATGQGLLAVTIHQGDWEAGAAGLIARYGVELYVVGKPPKNKPMSIALQEQREERGCHTLPRRGAMKFAPQIIEAGGVLAMVLDQRAAARPALAPFFGRPARSDRSAGVLIRRLRVPLVVFGFAKGEQPWTYRITTPAVFQPKDLAGLNPEQIAGKLNAVFERMILANPEQYFWLHDRFKDTPES